MNKLAYAIAGAMFAAAVATLPVAAQQPGARPVRELNVDAVPKLDVEGIRLVQQLLKDKGFDPGRLDGVTGPLTRGAVSSFQEKYGIKSRGDIDNQTLLALGAVDLAVSANSNAYQSQ